MRLKSENGRVETRVNNKPSSPGEHLAAINICRASLFLADRKMLITLKLPQKFSALF